jgi:hypothetical protein
MPILPYITNLGMGGGSQVKRLRRTGTIICPVSVTSGDQIRLRIQRVQGSSDVYVLADYTTLSIRTDRTIPS